MKEKAQVTGEGKALRIQYDADARRKAHPELNPYSPISYCYELESKLLAVTAQRDELLAAAIDFRRLFAEAIPNRDMRDEWRPIWKTFSAAIANAERGQK